MRFDFTDPDWELTQALERFLNTNADPESAAAGFDWDGFYLKLSRAAIQGPGVFGMVKSLPVYLPGETKRKALSERDRDVLDAVGEKAFRQLTNRELRERHKSALVKILGSAQGEAVRGCLNRIRRNMGFPPSKSIRLKNSDAHQNRYRSSPINSTSTRAQGSAT